MNNTKNTKDTKSEYQIVYSLRVRIELAKRGFEPLVEMDNKLKPPLKCWKYINTPEFAEAFSEIMRGGQK